MPRLWPVAVANAQAVSPPPPKSQGSPKHQGLRCVSLLDRQAPSRGDGTALTVRPTHDSRQGMTSNVPYPVVPSVHVAPVSTAARVAAPAASNYERPAGVSGGGGFPSVPVVCSDVWMAQLAALVQCVGGVGGFGFWR